MSNRIELTEAGRILSNIGNRLIQSQNILKLVSINSPDALYHPDISMKEIIKLTGKGDKPKEQRRIFNTPFNKIITDDIRSEIRYYIPIFKPNNIYLTEIKVCFQIIVDNTLWDIDDNGVRPIIMLQEILKLFNGYDIGSIGLLELDAPIPIYNWDDGHAGYLVSFHTRTV